MKKLISSMLARLGDAKESTTHPAGQVRVGAPTKDDLRDIAHHAMHAAELVQAAGDPAGLSGDLRDLQAIQRVLDSNLAEREATYSLQSLGIAFGRILIRNNESFDWCMVEDEYGRDAAIRYKATSIRVFPKTMISKRVEDGDAVDVEALYAGLQRQLESIRKEIDADA